MFKLTVLGKTVEELKKNLSDAAQGLSPVKNTVKQNATQEVAQPQWMDATTAQEEEESDDVDVRPGITQQAGGGLDARGIPWDERIHASSKSLNKDGTWRAKRGMDPIVLSQLEAKLLAEAKGKSQEVEVPAPPMPQAATPIAPPPLPPTTVPLQPVFAPTFVQPPVIQAPPPVYENIPVPQTTRPAHSFETFRANFIPVFADLVNQGKLDQYYINQLKEHFKVKEVWDIAKNESQLRDLFENFVGSGLITKVG